MDDHQEQPTAEDWSLLEPRNKTVFAVEGRAREVTQAFEEA